MRQVERLLPILVVATAVIVAALVVPVGGGTAPRGDQPNAVSPADAPAVLRSLGFSVPAASCLADPSQTQCPAFTIVMIPSVTAVNTVVPFTEITPGDGSATQYSP